MAELDILMSSMMFRNRVCLILSEKIYESEYAPEEDEEYGESYLYKIRTLLYGHTTSHAMAFLESPDEWEWVIVT